MIEIIQKGVLPPQTKRTYYMSCWHCGCTYKCNDEDFDSYDGIVNDSVIKCPCCGSIHVVNRGELAYKVEEK